MMSQIISVTFPQTPTLVPSCGVAGAVGGVASPVALTPAHVITAWGWPDLLLAVDVRLIGCDDWLAIKTIVSLPRLIIV
jgi:hypothetical protein